MRDGSGLVVVVVVEVEEEEQARKKGRFSVVVVDRIVEKKVSSRVVVSGREGVVECQVL